MDVDDEQTTTTSLEASTGLVVLETDDLTILDDQQTDRRKDIEATEPSTRLDETSSSVSVPLTMTTTTCIAYYCSGHGTNWFLVVLR